MSTKTSIEVYQVPEGEKRAGKWTFSVNGQPSLYYSDHQESIWRKIRSLTAPIQGGTVRLPAMQVGAVANGESEGVVSTESKPQTLTEFMCRGKLAERAAE